MTFDLLETKCVSSNRAWSPYVCVFVDTCSRVKCVLVNLHIEIILYKGFENLSCCHNILCCQMTQ